jgi:mono/diheme cytochrome c family protein
MKLRFALLAVAVAAIASPGCKKEEQVTAPPPGPSGGPPVPGPMGPGPMPGGPIPGPGTAQMVTLGKTVFTTNCVRCHGADGRGTRPGMPNFTSAAWHAKEPDAELLKAIQNGNPGKMPSFGTKLAPGQQQAVVAYLRSLSKPGT